MNLMINMLWPARDMRKSGCAEDATLPSLSLMPGLPTCVAVMTLLNCSNEKLW